MIILFLLVNIKHFKNCGCVWTRNYGGIGASMSAVMGDCLACAYMGADGVALYARRAAQRKETDAEKNVSLKSKEHPTSFQHFYI